MDTNTIRTDIVIYDNRILPPFIQEQNIGIYPAESVIATVEVKTTLDGAELQKAEEAAKRLKDNVFAGVFYGFEPLCAVFGFEGGVAGLSDATEGKAWLQGNVRCLFNICIAEKYSWANVGGKGRTMGTDDSGTYGETKRFLALLVDNARTKAQERFRYFVEEGHWDWFSMYIR